MIEVIKESLRSQFGAAIDTLTQVITLIPQSLWEQNTRYFYMAYHTTLMLDYYLTIPPSRFEASLPYKITDASMVPPGVIGDMVPERMFTKNELLNYVADTREKCLMLIAALTPVSVNDRFVEEFDDPGAMNYNLIEILLYNMRHVQHHTAQLNLMLRQDDNIAASWVFRSNDTGIS